MLIIKKYLFIFFILIYGIGFTQNFEFTARASKTNLALNQRVKVEFTVNQNGADNFKPSDFKGFRVVAGPSTSVSQSWINGKSSYAQSYIYFIEPTAQGTFTISGASVIFQGKEVRSNALIFTVTEAVEEPKNANDPANAAQDNIFLATFVSKENPYVGEGIFVEYRLYFSNKIEFNNPQFGQAPKYEGFWNQEIPITTYDRQVGDYKGEKLNYFTLKKTVLIPQKTGKLTIDPMEMDVVVGVMTGKYDFFGYPLMQRVNQHYTSGAKTVFVKPLPEKGKPADFTGAVGDYKFSVSANKNTLGANESAKIDVVVNGTGNLKLFELPKIIVPSELEVYTPEHTENVTTTLAGLKGSVTDSYAIVANYKGKYVIPATRFSYFNPKEGKYHELGSEEIVIDVTEGNLIDTISATKTNKQIVSTQNGGFRYIQTKTDLKPFDNYTFYGSFGYYALLVAPFASIPFFIILGQKRRERRADVKGNKLREANRLSKKFLSDAKKHIGSKELFYEALEKALHNFLKAKLNIETSDISQDRISVLLKRKNVSDANIQSFINVLNDCNFARFTPMVKGAMEAELDKAALVMALVDSEIK